jgi:vitamin B12 transporter
MKRSLAALLLCGASIVPLSAHAQSVESVTVTASRLPAPLSVTPGAYVVTEQQIQARGAPFVAEVLAEVPGVSITENGAFGGVSTLRLRGASGDKTVILIDGVPVNDPSQPTGGFDLSNLDAATISRIEVLNGPQSSLWGSDAIGGVVALTTREPEGVNLFVEGGSLATVRSSTALGHATDRYAFGLSLSTFRTDGISKADEKDGNSERDGDNATTLAANLRVSPSERVTLDARARINFAAVEYDGFGFKTGVADSSDSSESRLASGYVRAQVKDVLGFDQTLRADLMDLDRQYYGLYPFEAAGGEQVLRWSATRQAALYGLDLGVEHTSDQVNTGSGRQTRDTTGYYLVGRLNPLKALTLTGSLRRDEFQAYQGQTTGRIAAAYDLGHGFTAKASWGQGFKAPSIFQTTYYCFECIKPGPTPNLRPERADGWDAGLAWSGGPVRLQATWFDLRVRDQIDYLTGLGYRNIAQMKSSGIEAEASAELGHGVSAHGSYTHDDALDGPSWTRSLKVPRDSGSASLAWRGGPGSAEIGLRTQGAAPDVYGTIRPFAVAYVAGAYAVTPSVSLTARIENLAGSHYQEAFGYGEPGRTVFVGLRWKG